MCLSIPGKVVSIRPGEQMFQTGRVDFGGVIREVNLAYVPEVKIGDYVIVHVGFAISIVDPAEAEKTFEYLREMGELEKIEE